MNVIIIPKREKTTPFLKMAVSGKNIQNAEITKKSNEAPKKIFSQYTGLFVVALCNFCILLST